MVTSDNVTTEQSALLNLVNFSLPPITWVYFKKKGKGSRELEACGANGGNMGGDQFGGMYCNNLHMWRWWAWGLILLAK